MSAAKDPENEVKVGLRRSTRRRSTSTIDSEEPDTPKARRTTRQSTGLLNQVLEESTAKSDIDTKSETEVRPARRLSRRNSDISMDSPTVSLRLLRTRIIDTTASDTPKKTRTRRTTLGNIHEELHNDVVKNATDTPKKEAIASKITEEDIEKNTDTPIPSKRVADNTPDMPLNKSPQMENKETKVLKDIVKEDIEVTPMAQSPLTPIMEVKKKLRASLGLGSDSESEKTPQCSKIEEKAEETPVNIAKSVEDIKRKLRPSLSICQPDETTIEDKEIVQNKDEIDTPNKILNTSEKIPVDNPEVIDTEVDEIEHLYLSQDTDESNSPKRNRYSDESKSNQEDSETLKRKLRSSINDAGQESPNCSQGKKDPEPSDVSELAAETSSPRKLRSSLSSSQPDSPQIEQTLQSSPCKTSPKKESKSVIISPKASVVLVSVEEPDSKIVDSVDDREESPSLTPLGALKFEESQVKKIPKSESKATPSADGELANSQADACASSPLKSSQGTLAHTPKSEESRRLRSSLSSSKIDAEKSHTTAEDSSTPIKLSGKATPVITLNAEEARELRSPLNTSKVDAEESHTQAEDASSPVKLSRNATPVNTPKSEKSHIEANDSFSPLSISTTELVGRLRSSPRKDSDSSSPRKDSDSSSPPKPSTKSTPVAVPTANGSRQLRSSLSTPKVTSDAVNLENQPEDSNSSSPPKRSRNSTPVDTPTSDPSRQLRSSLSTLKTTFDIEKVEHQAEDSDSSTPPKRSRNSTPVNTPPSDASSQFRSSLTTSKVEKQVEDSDSPSSSMRSQNVTPINTPTSDVSRQLRSSLTTPKVTSDIEKIKNQADDADSPSPPKRSRNSTPVTPPTSGASSQLRSSLNTSKVEKQAEDSDSPSSSMRSKNATPVNAPTADARRQLRSSLSTSKATSDIDKIENQAEDSDSSSPPKRSRNSTPVNTPTSDASSQLRSSSLSSSKVTSDIEDSDLSSPRNRNDIATPVITPTSDEGRQLRSSLTSKMKAENTLEDSDSSSPSKRTITPVNTPISEEGRQLRSSCTSETLNSTLVTTPKSVDTKCCSSLTAVDLPRELTPVTVSKVPEIQISPSVKSFDENEKSKSFSVQPELKAMSPQLGSPVRVLRSSLGNSQSKLVMEEYSKTTSKDIACIDLDDSEIEFRQTPLKMLNGNIKYINIPKVPEENLVKPSSGVEEAVGSSSANQSIAESLLQTSTSSDKENENLNVTGVSNLNESTEENKSISQEPTQNEPDFNKTKDESELPNTPAKSAEDVLELRLRSIIKTPTASPNTKTEPEKRLLILEASPEAKSTTAEESDDELMNSFVNRTSSPLESESETKNPIASGSPGLRIGATPANTPVQKRLLRQLSPGKNSPKPVANIEEVEASSDEEDLTLSQKKLSAEKLTVLSETNSDVSVELRVSKEKVVSQIAKSLPGTVDSSKITVPSKNMSLVDLHDSDDSDGSESTILLTQEMRSKFSSDENEDANVVEDNGGNSEEERSYICTDEESDQNSLIDDEAMENSGSDTPSDGSNDIIEVGETLSVSSDEEEVDEEDEYEDNSFIASDSEDAELLSGTGDDLSLDSAESEVELLSQSKAAKQAFNKQKQYKRVQPISLDSSDDEDVEKPVKKLNQLVISSDDEEVEKPTQKSNQVVLSDEDEQADTMLEDSVFIADSQDNVEEEEEVEEEIGNVTVVLDKSLSLKAKQQEIKEKNKDTLENSVLEESEKLHKNMRNIDEKEKSPGTNSKNEANFDVGNESVIILEPTPQIKKKKSKKGRKKSIEAVVQELCEEEDLDGEEAPQLVNSPLIKKKKAKNIQVNDSPKPVDRQKKPQDSPKPEKKNKKSKKVSIEAIKSPQTLMEKSPLLKKSPKMQQEFSSKKSPLVEKKKSKKDRKLSPEIVSNEEDKKSGSKLHLVALNTRGRIPCIPISLLKELPESSPELPEITLPEKKTKKRKLQPEAVVESKKSKHFKDGVQIVSLSKSILPSSSGYTSCGFKEEMLNSNRIPRQSSIQLLNKKLKKESLQRKW